MQQTQNLTILRYERTRSRLLEILRFFSNYDLFEGYFSLTLNHGYTPDIARDSIMNDYHFLKFKNEKLNGIYVIIDANTRYKTNKIIPLDDVSKREYPFSINLLNEGACIFLDQIKTEQCECI